ncbi:ATP-binding cassette domain-containing protein [Cellulosimicrobium marinum]|uniref:ATP-binding cassette domain-containing protein n=1 Tax=Cellulosimicrobium marinum TaxID=1638992 RepID=UPI001E435C64|nr:ATP-binding cassette domain-containing protein [Cellulosimicrobium marinum]MCB7135949.1 ATP-binding cassette domain-containing protein [Cellulosimicrobium marinum]
MRIGAKNVSKAYGKTLALRSATFDLDDGITVLLGRNGAGKSTLCRVLAGVEAPDDGYVELDGTPFPTHSRAARAFYRRFGWLPQTFEPPKGMTVQQFLEYAGWLKDMPSATIETRIDQTLEMVHLENKKNERVGTLSGGMVRRLGIAQAIINEPGLVLLDEPSVGLDPEQRSEFHAVLASIAEERQLLVSTHLLEDAAVVADRCLVLDAGTLLFDGTMDALLELAPPADRAERIRSAFLGLVPRAS